MFGSKILFRVKELTSYNFGCRYAPPGEKPHYAPSFERTNWQLEQVAPLSSVSPSELSFDSFGSVISIMNSGKSIYKKEKFVDTFIRQ